jgi:hypothetical protein
MITPVTVTTSAEEEDKESPELTAVDAIVGHFMAEDEGKLVDLNAVMVESNKAAAVMKEVTIIILMTKKHS